MKKLSGNKRIQVDAIELVSDYSNAIKASSQRKNATPRQISKKSLKQDLTRWETKNLVRTAKAEETTSAREIACENIRNMTSALTAFSVQATEVPNFLMFNFDATSQL